jgi:hypothetical protein
VSERLAALARSGKNKGITKMRKRIPTAKRRRK